MSHLNVCTHLTSEVFRCGVISNIKYMCVHISVAHIGACDKHISSVTGRKRHKQQYSISCGLNQLRNIICLNENIVKQRLCLRSIDKRYGEPMDTRYQLLLYITYYCV